MENNWNKEDTKKDVEALAKAAEKDSNAPKIDADAGKKEGVESVVKYINYLMENKKENRAYAFFRFHVWFDGFDKGKVTTPMYSDAAVQLQKWHCDMNIKMFVVSNGWSEANKKFLSKTSHGDLNMLIDDHFDTSVGPLTEESTFKKLIGKIKEKPADITFLTKSVEEGVAAKSAGMGVVLVLTHRKEVDAAVEQCKDVPIARTFTDIEIIER